MTESSKITVNGREHDVHAALDFPLLYALRNDVGLNGPKSGCDLQQCGACTVLCDGQKVASCVTLVGDVSGKKIVTSEGLGALPHERALRKAFFEEQASQCGYCTAGMMIGASALLANNPNPSRDEIKLALDRHICRCGTHVRIVAAVERAVRELESGLTKHSADTVVAGFEPAVIAGDKAAVRTVRPEHVGSWLSISGEGTVTLYSGKIDMGTGIRAAYAQMVADELDVRIDKVIVVLGDTGQTPDQGKSTASAAVMLGGQPLRVAAAEARAALLEKAATRLGASVESLVAEEGTVFVREDRSRSLSYGELIGNDPLDIVLPIERTTDWGPELRPGVRLKSPDQFRYSGQTVLRATVAEHVSGTFEFVHNVRLPGMWHGRSVRPSSYEGGLVGYDETSIAHIPNVKVVRKGDFLGVVAEREEHAIQAARQLKVIWSDSAPLYEEAEFAKSLRNAEVVGQQTNFTAGEVDAALMAAPQTLHAEYHVGFQLHAMLGPSCAVADVRDGGATIWSGTQWPHAVREDIAEFLGLPADRVRVIWKDASGSYGRLGCDDAAADAALMSQLCGRPVRAQWTREEENAWEPVSAGASVSIRGALDSEGRVSAFDYAQWSSSHATAERKNFLAWRLVGNAPYYDRLTGNIYSLEYDVPHKRGRSVFVRPTFRTIYMRGPGSVQSHFATESFMDELATLAGADPVAFRLAHLPARDREVLSTVARISGWRELRRTRDRTGLVLRGRGVAICRYGLRDTLAAAVADVEVDRATGQVLVKHVWVAHDCGFMVNPDGVLNQVQGNVLHAVSRAVKEEAHYTSAGITTLNWDQYETLRFREMPEVTVELIQRRDMPPSVVGEIATIPTFAAVGNAVSDALGVRIREAPFVPGRIRRYFAGGN